MSVFKGEVLAVVALACAWSGYGARQLASAVELNMLQSENGRENGRDFEEEGQTRAGSEDFNATIEESASSIFIAQEDIKCAFECAWETTYGKNKLDAAGQFARDLKALALEMPTINLENAEKALEMVTNAQNSLSGKKKLADEVLFGRLKHEWHALFGVLKKHVGTKEKIGLWLAKWYTKPKKKRRAIQSWKRMCHFYRILMLA
jgi:hypothetical protein